MNRILKRKEIPLQGKLRTRDDPIVIGEDFRSLINLRYGNFYPRGILGHTKINTDVLDNPKIRSIHHLRKEQPSESHVIVQALDSNGANPKLYSNTTAIPDAGDFVGSGGAETVLYTEDTNAGVGRFAEGPDGGLVYCNGEETLLYGGTEYRVGSFIRYDPDDNTKKWDYTEQVSNADTSEVATLVKSGGALDANTKLLLHFDNDVTDTVGTHTVTNSGVTFNSSNYRFGGYSAQFTSGDYLTIPDHADFDFSGGTWTLDFWFAAGYGLISSDGTLFYQETDDNNYIRIWLDVTAPEYFYIKFDIYAAGSPTVQMSSGSIFSDQWNHLAIVEDGDDYYMFVSGTLVDSTNTANRADNYTGLVYIGNDNGSFTADYGGLGGDCLIDEFNVVNGTASWTSEFTPPASAYPVNGSVVYVGSILPIKGINFDVETKNTAACTPTIDYWDGLGWTSVGTVTDGTNNGAGALEQDGLMSFNSTASTAKARMIDSMYLYWYRLSLPGIDDTTTVSYVTVDIPFQTFKDIWDGELRGVLACLQWDGDVQSYLDHTIAVFEDYYDSADEGTFAKITDNSGGRDWDTGTDYLLIGSTDRLAGLSINIVAGKENGTTATMSVSYWDGDSWVSVGSVFDGTLESGITLAKSGFITWNPPSYGTEFKRQDLTLRRAAPGTKSTNTGKSIFEEGGYYSDYAPYGEILTKGERQERRLKESIKKTPMANAQFEYPLYWYKIELNADISAAASDIQIFHVGCIPAQVEIGAYNFPMFCKNEIWLLNETTQHKNQAIKLAPGTLNVANGSGASEFRVGTEEGLTGGGFITLVLGEKILPCRVLFKKNQTWAIFGSGQLSDPVLIDPHVGCVASGTIKNATIVTENTELEVLIFQAQDGIYMTTGSSVTKISRDIEDVFDQNSTTKILTSRAGNSEAFYDEILKEYHWLWTSTGTTHNKEYVFDCQRLKWFEIRRDTGAQIQCGTSVRSTTGESYVYGGLETGYVVRLENGTTFATASSTNNIVHTLELGDLAFDGISVETKLKNVILHSIGKTSTSNTIAVTHYGDTSTTGTSITAMDAGDSGERIQIINRQTDLGPYLYHRLKFVITNSDDTVGFEPIYLACLYEPIRQDVR